MIAINDPTGSDLGGTTDPTVQVRQGSVNPVNLAPFDFDPAGWAAGDTYYNTALNALRVYNTAGNWVTLASLASNTFTSTQTINPSVGSALVLQSAYPANAATLQIFGPTYTSPGSPTNIQEWYQYSNTGTPTSYIGPYGTLTIDNRYGAATAVPLSITANSGQSVNTLQILASDNSTVRAAFSSAGALTVSPSAGTALTLTPASGQKSQVWNNTSGAEIASMSVNGGLFLPRGTGHSIGPGSGSYSWFVNTGADANIGIVIKGHSATQSADLQQWQTSSATVAKFDANGALTVTPSAGTALTVNGVSSAVGLAIRPNATTPGNLTEWQDNAGTTIQSFVGSSGRMGVRTAGLIANASLSVGIYNTTDVGVAVKAAASQSSDLQQWQSNGGTVLGGRNALAQVYSGSTAPVTVTTGGATSGASSGTTATMTTATAHGLAVGDLVTIAGVTPSGYNGTYLVQTVPTTTTYTVTTSGSNLGASTVSGTTAVPAQASFTARSAGTVGLVARAAASPQVDMMQVQDSGGTSQFKIDISGNTVLNSSRSLYANTLSNISSGNNASVLLQSSGASIQTTVNSNVVLTVKNTGTPSTDLQQWVSGSTVLSSINSAGALLAPYIRNSAANGAYLSLTSSYMRVRPGQPGTIGMLYSGETNQTADLTQYTDISLSILGGRNAVGQVWSGSTAPVTVATGGATSGTSSGTTATLTTATAHGLTSGDLVTIAGMTPSGYNGTYIATVTGSTTYTVTTSGSNLGASTVSGTTSVPAQASFTSRSAGTVGLVARAAASAVADLTQWQNSSGTVLAKVDYQGSFAINDNNTSPSNLGYALRVKQNSVFDSGAIGVVPVNVWARTGQTANLTNWYSDLGTTIVGGRNAVGQTWSGSTAPVTVTTGGATSGTSSGTTATMTTASAHGLAVGDLVTIAGVTPSGYNGTYLVATVPTTTTYTVTTSGSNLGASTVSGTTAVPAQASFTARSAGTVGLVVRAPSSATANLMELWANGASSATSYFTSAGSLVVSTINGNSYQNISSSANSRLQLTTSGAIFDTSVQGNVLLKIQNTNASPSGDLTQWLNNSGAVLARIDNTGALNSTANISTGANLRVGSQNVAISGSGIMALANAGTVPSANSTNGGYLYAEGGALKWRGSSGGVTIVADASTASSVETIKADGNQSATFAIDAGAGTTHTVTLTGSIGTALTFSNLPSDGSITLTLIITQDATGSRTITWPSGTKWAGGTAPTLSTAANAVDIVTLVVNRSGGSTSAVYGFLSGKAFA